jgi:hypothetical protein
MHEAFLRSVHQSFSVICAPITTGETSTHATFVVARSKFYMPALRRLPGVALVLMMAADNLHTSLWEIWFLQLHHPSLSTAISHRTPNTVDEFVPLGFE